MSMVKTKITIKIRNTEYNINTKKISLIKESNTYPYQDFTKRFLQSLPRNMNKYLKKVSNHNRSKKII